MTRRVILTPPTINALTMPSWFYDRWDAEIEWIPPRSVREGPPNARGEYYSAGWWTLEWRWSRMHQSWWRWWTVDVLNGALQLTCDITIWSPNGIKDGELTTYEDVIVYHPAIAGPIKMAEGEYKDVTVRIGRIALATLPATQYWTVSLTSVGSDHEIS